MEGMKLIHQPSEGATGTFRRRSRRCAAGHSRISPFGCRGGRSQVSVSVCVASEDGSTGKAGFTYCVLQSFYEYMIVLKMRELERRAQGITEVTAVAAIEPVATVSYAQDHLRQPILFPRSLGDESATE